MPREVRCELVGVRREQGNSRAVGGAAGAPAGWAYRACTGMGAFIDAPRPAIRCVKSIAAPTCWPVPTTGPVRLARKLLECRHHTVGTAGVSCNVLRWGAVMEPCLPVQQMDSVSMQRARPTAYVTAVQTTAYHTYAEGTNMLGGQSPFLTRAQAPRAPRSRGL